MEHNGSSLGANHLTYLVYVSLRSKSRAWVTRFSSVEFNTHDAMCHAEFVTGTCINQVLYPIRQFCRRI